MFPLVSITYFGSSCRLRVIAKLQCSSLRLVDAAAVAEVLVQHVLPPSFRGKHQVPWDRQKPPPQWLLQLWEWLRQQQDSSAALLTFTAWPIVPTQQGTLVAPCRTARSTLILGPKEHGEWTPELTFALTKLGCGIVDASALGSADGLAASTAHPPDASGVLCALQNCLARQKATSTSAWLDSAGILPAERDALLQLLARRQWFERSRQLQPEQVQFMRSLPIYASAAGYVELHTAQRYLPPPDLHAALRGCNQLFTNKALLKLCGRETESVLIDFLGVKQLTKAVFYKKSVLPTLHRLDATVSEAVAVEILREVPLLQQADRTVVDALRSSPIVTTAGGGTAQPQELYDPRNSELVAFLDPAASFPSGKFGPVLDQLTQLGMRTTAGRDTILLAASQIQDLATSEKAPLAAARSRALLAYLDAHAARLQAASSSRESAEQANGFQLEAVFSRVANLLTGEGQQPEANSRATEEANNREAQEFWETLRQVSWCPVSQDCPLPGLPWCGQGQNATTAPPTAVRPRKDLWLASSQRCILDGEVRSAVLLKAMGWDASLPPSVLAAQLGALGAAFTHVSDTAARQQLAEVAPQLYRALSKLPPAALESVRSKIGEDPCIWIGDGFAPVSKVALR